MLHVRVKWHTIELMLTQLTIPKKINVGFQDRQGTYTGKLAYVIYTDAKGVLRKQKSWDGWRDKKIDPQEFENKPTSGFVLNKKVGETRWGWNPRKAWVRIFDPRGFEFEISVANLVFILEEVTSTRGKGLEGEFVYAWDGAELVLLPACSQEYKSSTTHTELQTKKITKSDMREGCLYLNKDNEQVMYLGRHEFWDLSEYNFGSTSSYKDIEHSKQHVFVSTDGKSTYWPQAGFTKLAAKLSEEPLPSFADEYEKFKKSGHSAPPISLVGMPTKFDLESEYYNWLEKPCFIKKEDLFYPAILEETTTGLLLLYTKDRPVSLIDEKVFFAEPDTYGFHRQPQQLSKEQAAALEFYEVCLKNENGGLLALEEDFGDLDEDEDI